MLVESKQVLMDVKLRNKKDGIVLAVEFLCDLGYVKGLYIKAMIDYDSVQSTYLGNGVALIYGPSDYVLKSGVVLIQVSEGVDFDNNNVIMIFGVSSNPKDHMQMLSSIAIACSNPEHVIEMGKSYTAQNIVDILNS